MRRIIEAAGLQKVDCYVECGDEKNKLFYEKFGFKAVETELVRRLEQTRPRLSASRLSKANVEIVCVP